MTFFIILGLHQIIVGTVRVPPRLLLVAMIIIKTVLTIVETETDMMIDPMTDIRESDPQIGNDCSFANLSLETMITLKPFPIYYKNHSKDKNEDE